MKIRRIDYSPDEFLAGTAMLTDTECGLYWRACSLIYSVGGPIRIDHLRAVSRAHGNAFNAALDRLLGLGKLERNGDEIDQKRARNELEKALKRSETARENVSHRWKNSGLGDDLVLPRGNANHQPSTINHQKKGRSEDLPRPSPAQIAGDMVASWKAEVGDLLPVPIKITAALQRSALLRWHDDFGASMARWREYLQMIRGSPFLVGDNDRGWRADFEFALRPKTVRKVREGCYGNSYANGIIGGAGGKPRPRQDDGGLIAAARLAFGERSDEL